MKILIGSPYMIDMRGNTITATRIIHFLRQYSVDTIGFDYYDSDAVAGIHEQIRIFDVLHILNPVRYLTSVAYKMNIHGQMPYGITFTGTDVNCHLDPDNNQLKILLTQADFITVFHQQSLEVLIRAFPELSEKVTVIAQSFFVQDTITEAGSEQGNQICDLIDRFKGQGKTVIILPAGIRQVKRVPWAIEMFDRFVKTGVHRAFLCVVGPMIEQQEMVKVTNLISLTDCVAYFHEIDHSSVLRAIEKADVLLNCSASEGQSLAIMEAFQLHTPVIASDVPGNAQMIQHGVTGLLFNDEQGFQRSLLTLMEQREYAQRLTQNAYEYGRRFYSAAKEVSAFIKLYKQCIDNKKTNGRNDDGNSTC